MKRRLGIGRFLRLEASAPWIAIGLCTLLMGVPVSAQDGPRVGAKGGMNLSGFYGAVPGDSESLQAIVLGVFGQFDIGGPFSLQPEFNYSRRGAREADLLEAATEGVWHYDYLDLVTLLSFRANSERSLASFSFFGGPVLSILKSSKATGLRPEGLHRECRECELKLMSLPFVQPLGENTKGTDIGGTVGMAIDVGSGPVQLVLDARYTKMVNEFDEAPLNEIYSRKHSAFSVQVGFSISPSAWREGWRRPVVPPDDPDRHSVVTLDVIERDTIAARDESLSVYDIIRLERPQWMDGDEVVGTLFVDGAPWEGSAEILRNRRGSEVEEVLRMEGAPGVYLGYGVVIEVITRGELWR